MLKKTNIISKEILEQEEQEAKERGITIFQLRHYKKLSEKRKKGQEKYLKQQKLEKERKQLKEKKKKERELLKKNKLKEEKKLKKQKKKDELKKDISIEQKPKKKYKKKSVGRPKKPGRKINYYKRKKKRLEEEKKKLLPKKYAKWNYKIVSCRNGKQISFIGKYNEVQKAYEKINELLKQSDNVVFPSLVSHNSKIVDTKYEYLILERKENITDDTVNYLRNDYGKLVEQRTNSVQWKIYDKFQYKTEETFWVWGYNNKTDRKTFKWIYDNVLVGKIYTNYDLRFVCLFKNKIVFKDDDENLDIIFCKTQYDAVRFYNLLEELIKKDKIRQVFFLGSFNKINDKRRKLEEKLIETTGWTKKKIQMSSTTEHTK